MDTCWSSAPIRVTSSGRVTGEEGSMARIAGVNIPREKRVEIGLTYIFGIGRSTSSAVLAELGISPDTKVRDLTEEEVARLRNHIDRTLTVEGDLRRERSQNIKRLT